MEGLQVHLNARDGEPARPVVVLISCEVAERAPDAAQQGGEGQAGEGRDRLLRRLRLARLRRRPEGLDQRQPVHPQQPLAGDRVGPVDKGLQAASVFLRILKLRTTVDPYGRDEVLGLKPRI